MTDYDPYDLFTSYAAAEATEPERLLELIQSTWGPLFTLEYCTALLRFIKGVLNGSKDEDDSSS